MRSSNNIQNHARHHVGLILALVGLISGVALMPWSGRLASAQAVAPSWSYTGSLSTALQFYTATLLQNGKVLVAGGQRYNGNHPPVTLSSAEQYDPATGTWSSTGNLNEARAFHTATLLPNGKVLVAGGCYDFNPNNLVNSAELYDPSTGTWTSTGNLNAARDAHTATLLANGKVLVAGGYDGTSLRNLAELYDPATGTWSSTGNLNTGRYSHTATLLPNGKVLIAGGVGNCDSNRGCFALTSAEVYDPATGTWSSTGNLNDFTIGHTATLLSNGKVLVVDFNSAELYDPTTEKWSGIANSPEIESHTATLLLDGKVLIAGGLPDCFGGCATNRAELYDPATGTWSDTARLNKARDDHTATLLPNGKVLVAGGSGDNTAELYDPGTSSNPNQIDDAQFFVRQHYRDFLNRDPDPDGLAFWINEITSCGGDAQCIEAKRINVSAAYFLSIEFQQTGYLVYRMYKSSYGNIPSAPVPIRLNEFLPDTQEIGYGVIVNQTGWETVLENNKQAFATEFVQRSRFTSAYPTSMTPDAFVDTLFANAGVTPSASDRAAAITEFGSAMTTSDVVARARALRRVAENSTQAQQEFNRAFVLMQYFGYLRRNPNDPPELTLDFQGYNFWLAKLDQFNGNFVNAEMVKAFLVSTEYRQRFGQP